MNFWKKKYHSNINGEMIFTRSIDGSWYLNIPEGMQYSGTYLENMWHKVFSIYKDDKPTKILIIGSGAGCAVHIARKIWKNAEIHAVDYDSKIIEVGKDIYDFQDSKVEFIVNDAVTFMKNTQNKYDFIVVDIFVGNNASPIIKSSDFIKNIKNILSSSGSIVMNIGLEDEGTISFLKSNFPTLDVYKYKANFLFISQTRPIPDDYYDMFQSQLFSRILSRKGYKMFGEAKQQAITQSIFGFSMITFPYTDIEPDILTIKKAGFKHGVVLWVPWKLRFAPDNWRKSFFSLRSKGNGFSLVTESYKLKWNETARRDLKKFESSIIKIESCDKDYFLNGMKNSISKRNIQEVAYSLVEQTQDEEVKYWVAKKENGEVLGGLAVVDYDNISHNLTSYITHKGDGLYIGTGLIDQWYKYALLNKIKYLNFGYIREQGDPKTWEGFSNFKRKFIDMEIVLSNGYFRFF